LFDRGDDRLQGHEQWLLLSILNSHVRFEVSVFAGTVSWCVL
jgi:hypothetical protein